MSLLVGTRPKVRIRATPTVAAPEAVVTDLKVIVKPPSPGVQAVYDFPDATITELDDNDFVWEAPLPLTVVGHYVVFVRSTAGIEASAELEFSVRAAAVVYA